MFTPLKLQASSQATTFGLVVVCPEHPLEWLENRIKMHSLPNMDSDWWRGQEWLSYTNGERWVIRTRHGLLDWLRERLKESRELVAECMARNPYDLQIQLQEPEQAALMAVIKWVKRFGPIGRRAFLARIAGLRESTQNPHISSLLSRVENMMDQRTGSTRMWYLKFIEEDWRRDSIKHAGEPVGRAEFASFTKKVFGQDHPPTWREVDEYLAKEKAAEENLPRPKIRYREPMIPKRQLSR